MNQVEEFQQPHRATICWDITTLCNYKCPYCYAHNIDYAGSWGKRADESITRLICSSLMLCKIPHNLVLMGGEPTVEPLLPSIVKWLTVKPVHDRRLIIVTNGSNPNALECMPKDTIVALSYHPHINPTSFISAIEATREMGFFVNVHLPLSNVLVNGAKIEAVFNYCLENNVHTELYFLYNPETETYFPYSQEELKYLGGFALKDKVYTLPHFNVSYTPFELYTKGYHDNRGCTCWNNQFTISYEGILGRRCDPSYEVDIKSHPFALSKVDIEPMQCTKDQCLGAVLLTSYKEGLRDRGDTIRPRR